MKPQRVRLPVFVVGASKPGHQLWGGEDTWIDGEPAVECSCGWSTNVQSWEDVLPTAKRHLFELIESPTPIRAQWWTAC